MEILIYALIFILFVMDVVVFRQIRKINDRLSKEDPESVERLKNPINPYTAEDVAAKALDRHVSEYHKKG